MRMSYVNYVINLETGKIDEELERNELVHLL